MIPVGNGPGDALKDVVEALKLVRAGKNISKGAKSVFIEYAKPNPSSFLTARPSYQESMDFRFAQG